MPIIPEKYFELDLELVKKMAREEQEAIGETTRCKMCDAYRERIGLLTQVVTKSRDEIYVASRLLRDTMNPNSIVGTEIYEQMRRTHEFLRRVVLVLEGGTVEEPE